MLIEQSLGQCALLDLSERALGALYPTREPPREEPLSDTKIQSGWSGIRIDAAARGGDELKFSCRTSTSGRGISGRQIQPHDFGTDRRANLRPNARDDLSS
jgi:hypothetical protein